MDESATQTQVKDPVTEKVAAAIEKIRPAIQMDGGDVEFVSFEDGTVNLRLLGACVGCPMSQMTLYMGIQEMLQREVPEVKQVMTVE